MEFREDPFIKYEDNPEDAPLKFNGMIFKPIRIDPLEIPCYIETELEDLEDVLVISLLRIGMYKYLQVE